MKKKDWYWILGSFFVWALIFNGVAWYAIGKCTRYTLAQKIVPAQEMFLWMVIVPLIASFIWWVIFLWRIDIIEKRTGT